MGSRLVWSLLRTFRCSLEKLIARLVYDQQRKHLEYQIDQPMVLPHHPSPDGEGLKKELQEVLAMMELVSGYMAQLAH
jgi:hypothetical protein